MENSFVFMFMKYVLLKIIICKINVIHKRNKDGKSFETLQNTHKN